MVRDYSLYSFNWTKWIELHFLRVDNAVPPDAHKQDTRIFVPVVCPKHLDVYDVRLWKFHFAVMVMDQLIPYPRPEQNTSRLGLHSEVCEILLRMLPIVQKSF